MFSIFIASVVLIFNTDTIAGATSSTHFETLTKYAEVEKIAIQYAGWKDTFKGKLAQLRSNLVTDICNSSLEVRINFCKKALHVHHFGYEFDLSHYLHLPCEQQDFWTKSPIPSKAGPFQADMFSCPPIIYRDMETDKEMFLPYIYSASRGLAHDAVFTFVQEKTSNTKYPFQYIKNINFKKLKKENLAHISSYLEPKIRYKYASISLENLLGLQFHRTEMFKIYEKFSSRFLSFNVCGLRREYKIFLCRRRLLSALFDVNSRLLTEGYDGRCRRHPVERLHKIVFGSKRELTVVPCPTHIRQEGLDISIMDTNLHYISSNALKYSTTLFRRPKNMRGARLQLIDSHNSQVDIAAIDRDRQKDRFTLYPSEDERMSKARQRSYEDILNQLNTLRPTDVARRESTIISYTEINMKTYSSNYLKFIAPLQAVWLAEDLIISFSKIKKATQVYTRFKETYSSLDLHKLSDKERQEICGQISPIIDINKLKPISMLIGFKIGWFHRRQVLLQAHEIEDLTTDTFFMWECEPLSDSPNYRYFVGTTNSGNRVVLFRSSFIEPTKQYNGNEVYPYGVITYTNKILTPSSDSSIVS